LSLAALTFNTHYPKGKTAFPGIERAKYFHKKLNYVLLICENQTLSQRSVKS